MSARLAHLPVLPELPTEAAYLRANRIPETISLGTAVQLPRSAAEGVVIEVVARGETIRTCGVRRRFPQRAVKQKLYVVQCCDCRVLRRAGEMVVVAL